MVFKVNEPPADVYSSGKATALILARGGDPQPNQVCRAGLCARQGTELCPNEAHEGFCQNFQRLSVPDDELEAEIIKALTVLP